MIRCPHCNKLMPKTGLGGYTLHMRSVNADKKIYKAIVAFQTNKTQNASLMFKNLIKSFEEAIS